MSKLAKRGGSQLNVIWHFSDSTLLYPGMPVKFVIMQQGNRLLFFMAFLLYAHDVIALEGSGVMARNTIKLIRCYLFLLIENLNGILKKKRRNIKEGFPPFILIKLKYILLGTLIY